MERNIRVLLNGREVYGYPGQTILDLCKDCGVDIPFLCYDPHLSTHGGCSVCLVEVKGAKALVRACSNKISQGMEIYTNTERTIAARRTALELLLSDHVGDCRPPCTLACPARGDVQGYVNLAASGFYKEALDLLHENVTLPASIGRICPAPCQEKCRRNFVDEEPVSIREIKRFVGDWAIENGMLGHIDEIQENGHSVAIVGGGPAGLSAAFFLRKKGYAVTIFEKESHLGGMMRYGIPEYRLPRDILQKEIDWLLSWGIKVQTDTALGRDITLEQLRREFDAILLAFGCWQSTPLRVPGENLKRVFGGINFLYQVNNHLPVEIGKKVAVIGGGNTAMDACRCAKRLGAEEVTVVYRRTRQEMPAEDAEIEEAMEEGVNFIFLAAPKEISGDESVRELVCEKMVLGEPDESGRRRPIPTGETFTLTVDTVIAAIGQRAVLDFLPPEIHDGRKILGDDNYATPLEKVFLCGDLRTGPDIAIAAIGEGHFAAESIHHFITRGYPKRPFECDVTREDLGPEDFRDKKKQPREMPKIFQAEERLEKPFEEFNMGLTEEQVKIDASRCMECGCPDVFECKLRSYSIEYEASPTRLSGERIKRLEEKLKYFDRNMDKCILCGRCVRTCDEIIGLHAIDFVSRGFVSTIHDAYMKPLDESECTGCGLCVQLCPVGALTEKRKERWPHSEIPTATKTTCGECSLGCEIYVNADKGKRNVVRVTTELGSPTSPTRGLCCFKARTFHLKRQRPEINKDIKETLSELVDFLRSEGVVSLFLGNSLSNEEYESIKEFLNRKGQNIAVSILEADDFKAFTSLAEEANLKRCTLGQIYESDVVFVIDENMDQEVPLITTMLRKNVREDGLKVIYLGSAPGLLDRGTTILLKTDVAEIYPILESFTDERLIKKTSELSGIKETTLVRAINTLKSARHPIFLAGPKVTSNASSAKAFVKLCSTLDKCSYIPLYRGANTEGALRVLGDILTPTIDNLSMIKKGQVTKLVLVEPDQATVEVLQGVNADNRAKCALLASRSFEDIKADLVMPIAGWYERQGKVINVSGEILKQEITVIPQKKSKTLSSLIKALTEI